MDINTTNALKVTPNSNTNLNSLVNSNSIINNNLPPIMTNTNSNSINNNQNNNNTVVHSNHINGIKNLNNNVNHSKSHPIIKDKTNDMTIGVKQTDSKVVVNSQTNHKSSKASGQPSQPPHPSSPLHPVPAPRRHTTNDTRSPSVNSMVDRTPCGSESVTPSSESYETPPPVRWQQDFHHLIDDVEGVALFKEFLNREGGLEYLLDFYFACRGLKSQVDDKSVKRIAYVMCKKFIRNSLITCISKEVRQSLIAKVGASSQSDPNGDTAVDRHVFDAAQQEVEVQLKGAIYQNFLSSELYLNYVHKYLIPDSQCIGVYEESISGYENSITSEETSLDDYNPRNQIYEVLPTLHEYHELDTTNTPMNTISSNASSRSQANRPVDDCQNPMSTGFSSDTLRRQLNSLLAPKRPANSSSTSRLTTESHPMNTISRISHPGYQSYVRSKQMAVPPNPYHVTYAPNLPPSAQDSEVSTNESTSCVSAPAKDGSDTGRIRSKKHMTQQMMQQNAKMNSNPKNAHTRDLWATRAHSGQKAGPSQPLSSDEFIKILIEKLDVFRIRQEKDMEHEMRLKHLMIMADPNNPSNSSNSANTTSRHSTANASDTSRPNNTLKEVLKQKLEFCSPPGDNGQDILDQHIAQVFADTPIVTPTDSVGRIGVSSPKTNFMYNNMTAGSSTSVPMAVNSYTYDPSGADTQSIVAIVKYSCEQMPYRLPMTGPPITLRKFKMQIPTKRGNWQYYFKRQCNEREAIDISAHFVLEKITDDNTRLPLIGNKIYAELQESN